MNMNTLLYITMNNVLIIVMIIITYNINDNQ